MIKIEVETIGNKIQSIKVSGHANFSNYGNDIVCAGITAIVTGTLNALEIMQNNNCQILVKNNLIEVRVINDNDYLQCILQVMYHQLKTVFLQYQENIQFKEVVKDV